MRRVLHRRRHAAAHVALDHLGGDRGVAEEFARRRRGRNTAEALGIMLEHPQAQSELGSVAIAEEGRHRTRGRLRAAKGREGRSDCNMRWKGRHAIPGRELRDTALNCLTERTVGGHQP